MEDLIRKGIVVGSHKFHNKMIDLSSLITVSEVKKQGELIKTMHVNKYSFELYSYKGEEYVVAYSEDGDMIRYSNIKDICAVEGDAFEFDENSVWQMTMED